MKQNLTHLSLSALLMAIGLTNDVRFFICESR